MAVINGSGDNNNGIKHGIVLTETWAGMSIASLGTTGASGSGGTVVTTSRIRPTTGQLWPRGDGVPRG